MSAWMLYTIVAGSLVAAAALAAERAAGAAGWSTRWVWLAAVAASVSLPVALPRLVGPGDADRPVLLGTVGAMWESGGAATSFAGGALWNDRVLLLGWGTASAILLVLFLGSLRVLERRRRAWRRRMVAGAAVLVSERTGPALVGFLAPHLVIPAWMLGWDEESLRLLVAHEREHRNAGDPLLLLAAAGALILLPWNLPLWWQARRLRLAIEVDCDARVLRRSADVRAYAELLLEVGRCASRIRVPAAAFSGSSSFLERRLRVIGRTRPIRRSAVVAFTLMAALPPIVLYSLPVPGSARIAGLTDAAPAPRGVPPQRAGGVDRTGAGSSGASMAAAHRGGEPAIQDRVDGHMNDRVEDGMVDRGTGIAVWTTPGREPHGARPVTLVAGSDTLTRGHTGPDRR